MSLSKITPHEAKRLIDQGAVLIDIRDVDEHERERIPGARNVTLGSGAKLDGKAPIVFHCRSGMRTSANAGTLAAAANGQAYILDGGLDAWKLAGLPVATDRSKPIDIMRQVQIAAGSLVLLGVASRLPVAAGVLCPVGFHRRRPIVRRNHRLVRHGETACTHAMEPAGRRDPVERAAIAKSAEAVRSFPYRLPSVLNLRLPTISSGVASAPARHVVRATNCPEA